MMPKSAFDTLEVLTTASEDTKWDKSDCCPGD